MGTQRDGRHIKTAKENLEYSTALELRVSLTRQFREDPSVHKLIKVLLLSSFILLAIAWLTSNSSSHSVQPTESNVAKYESDD